MTAAEKVFEAVRGVTFGPEQSFRNLTLIPLMATHTPETDYMILDDALRGSRRNRRDQRGRPGA